MNNKTLAIVSYITVIGWLIAYFSYKDETNKSPFVTYHLKQSLGVFVVSVVISVIASILIAIIPTLATALSLLSVIPLVLLVLGIINAVNEVMKPVPLIGGYFEDKFSFIK
ncbi:DUF4870 domain-containing protein [Sphingobacterium hungaricum]|uniref:Import component protein n=1 Tax=Sphingobacterium hungaricum TaxID=2082723 RepID=A0A928UZV8_9SPHI|nr:DUF4870 domain-containing protein [Sphingobacterium hungaricum]MBE8714411.1 import component protein [Sphingobacterium hungaricum]